MSIIGEKVGSEKVVNNTSTQAQHYKNVINKYISILLNKSCILDYPFNRSRTTYNAQLIMNEMKKDGPSMHCLGVTRLHKNQYIRFII